VAETERGEPDRPMKYSDLKGCANLLAGSYQGLSSPDGA
jgi:hypothetical protein